MRRTECSVDTTRWGTLRRMFAHSTQNWWWTAHPAAH
ncbi:trp operon leader peptide [Streptomyces mutabilis]